MVYPIDKEMTLQALEQWVNENNPDKIEITSSQWCMYEQLLTREERLKNIKIIDGIGYLLFKGIIIEELEL